MWVADGRPWLGGSKECSCASCGACDRRAEQVGAEGCMWDCRKFHKDTPISSVSTRSTAYSTNTTAMTSTWLRKAALLLQALTADCRQSNLNSQTAESPESGEFVVYAGFHSAACNISVNVLGTNRGLTDNQSSTGPTDNQSIQSYATAVYKICDLIISSMSWCPTEGQQLVMTIHAVRCHK